MRGSVPGIFSLSLVLTHALCSSGSALAKLTTVRACIEAFVEFEGMNSLSRSLVGGEGTERRAYL